MPALEPVLGIRIVASPAALDAARWAGTDVHVLRIAPDEALGLLATAVAVDDADAIIEPETGFSVARLAEEDKRDLRAHVEWDPAHAGSLAQGKVAGVPARLVRGEPATLVVQTAYGAELTRRLGW